MSEYPQLSNAPIREALIDFRVRLPVDFSQETLRDLANSQIGIDGFTFSRLAPYESWDRMEQDAWVVWKRYVEGLKPLGVERIATPMNGVSVIVSLATEEDPDASVILDIDCFIKRSFETEPEVLGLQLPKLRDAKNRVFFGSLTSKVIGEFK